MSSSSAILTPPAATPHLRAVRSVTAVPAGGDRWHPAAAGPPSTPAAAPTSSAVTGRVAPELFGALPEGATVVAALPQSVLPQALLAQYGAQLGTQGTGRPLVGYLVLVSAESVPGAVAPLGLAPLAPPTAPPAPAPEYVPVPDYAPLPEFVPQAVAERAAPVEPVASFLSEFAPEPAVQRPVRQAGRGISVDLERRSAYVDGELLDLTYLEFELLAHLTQHPQRVHTRDHLVSAVWGYGHVGDGRTVDVHVARLRRKLGAAHRDSIVTVRRVGYKYAPIGRG
ncbi:winged helix-turn-helix domain-containing protein [Kitasatospora sp. NPDC008050]|uniref:winged helix-turn-helix domain-containing protein n=1 Tax=Kitasatospora sp. NPDC008050 TaxID=3364021 RepID=UPI0036EC1720